jgi:hypothetical protein
VFLAGITGVLGYYYWKVDPAVDTLRNLSSLSAAVQAYIREKKTLPPMEIGNLAVAIHPYLTSDKAFFDSEHNRLFCSNYTVTNSKLTAIDDRTTMPLFAQFTPGRSGRAVAFADGTVRVLDENEYSIVGLHMLKAQDTPTQPTHAGSKRQRVKSYASRNLQD